MIFNQADLQAVHLHLLSDILGENKLTEDSWHQSIMNVGYQWWQKAENRRASYGEMIHHVQATLGNLPALLILLGKYNQQVENGGHYQYLHNGYAGEQPGLRETDPDLSLHDLMTDLMKHVKLDETELGKKVMSLFQEFFVVDEGETEYWEDGEDDESGEMVEIEECDLQHEWNVLNDEALNTRYYEFNEQWVAFIEAELVKVLGPLPITTTEVESA